MDFGVKLLRECDGEEPDVEKVRKSTENSCVDNVKSKMLNELSNVRSCETEDVKSIE